MKDRLARYIANDLLDQRDRSIADDEDLLESGLLDSLSVMSLVHFIEQELRIEVPAEDVTIDNFVSLAAIEAYIARRGAP
jgi:acyl carrier protein